MKAQIITRNNSVITTHKLNFESAPWIGESMMGYKPEDHLGFKRLKVGSCYGLFKNDVNSLDILAVINAEPGNGHFDDVMEWFEGVAAKYHKKFRILELVNPRFEKHLIEKRKFKKKKDYLYKKPR